MVPSLCDKPEGLPPPTCFDSHLGIVSGKKLHVTENEDVSKKNIRKMPVDITKYSTLLSGDLHQQTYL